MRVWIGSESGSQRILDAMQRGVTVEQVQSAVALCRENGIQTGMFLMWGYEGEDISDIEATVEHVRECRPDVFFTTVSYPIKGTPYFDKVAAKLVSIKPWSTSTDREFADSGPAFAPLLSIRRRASEEGDVGAARSEAILAARNGLRATYAEVEA